MHFKRRIFFTTSFLSLLLFFVSSINALEISEKGFKVGANFSNSTGEFVYNTKLKAGFVGGVFLTNKITQIISIQAELLYSNKGYLIDENNHDIKATFTYLQFPLFIKLSLISTENLKFALLCGPSINYNLSAKYDSKIFGINYSGNINNFKEFDLGADLGLSIQKKINDKRSIIVDLRYEFGLLPWDEIDEENFNRTFSVLVGISI